MGKLPIVKTITVHIHEYGILKYIATFFSGKSDYEKLGKSRNLKKRFESQSVCSQLPFRNSL